jgi:organic radical activating enzyme
MNCEILRTLYIKANGEILCNDDHGEQVVLGVPKYESSNIGIHDILRNDRYEHIRRSYQSGRVPWPGICDKCAFYRPEEPFTGDLLSKNVIQKIQIESSLSCSLRCLSCSNERQIAARARPLHYPLEWLEKMLVELKAYHYRIELIEFCGQGEPLNHPDFVKIPHIIRNLFPEARIRVITNGNHVYKSKIGDNFIEETIVSIDGATQKTYGHYRVHGDILKALSFLKESVASQIHRGGTVIWKYILLNTNDSDEEILLAQEMASRIGVSRLWFVHGHGHMKSIRYTYENALSIPVVYPNIKIESHPSYNRNSSSINGIGSIGSFPGSHSGAVWIDTAVIHPNDTLTLTGWANCTIGGLDKVFVKINYHAWMNLPLEISRNDVCQAMPQFSTVLCGFDVLLPCKTSHVHKEIFLKFKLFLSNGLKPIVQISIPLATTRPSTKQS